MSLLLLSLIVSVTPRNYLRLKPPPDFELVAGMREPHLPQHRNLLLTLAGPSSLPDAGQGPASSPRPSWNPPSLPDSLKGFKRLFILSLPYCGDSENTNRRCQFLLVAKAAGLQNFGF